MKLIIDISNLLHAAFKMQWKDDLPLEDLEKYCRHTIINTIYTKIKDLKINQNNVIIATDSSSWRKDFFPLYKHNRKVAREKSKIDAELMFNFFNNFLKELDEIFPFIVVKENKCEADDIIAVLAKHLSKDESVTIISRDKDFLQLIDKSIGLFDPFIDDYVIKGKIKDYEMTVTTKEHAKIYKMLHILIGDTTDGIMNILSPDHILAFPKDILNKKGDKVIKERQTPLGWKKIKNELFTNEELDFEKYKEFVTRNEQMKTLKEDYDSFKINEETYKKELNLCKEIRKNYIRNKKLIDLNEIPKEMEEKIIKNYKEKVKNKVNDIAEISKYFKYHELDELNIKLLKGEFTFKDYNKLFDR